MISHNSLNFISFISPISCFGFTGISGDNKEVCKCHSGVVTMDGDYTCWHVQSCTHTHTQTHASTRDWSTVKTLVLIQIKADATCFMLVSFKTCGTSKAETTHAPAKKKPVFSVIVASIQYLCFRCWLLIKKVCSVSDDFSPAIAAYAALSWHSFWFWIMVVILFGLLRSEFVPTSIRVLVQQDQTEKWPKWKSRLRETELLVL